MIKDCGESALRFWDEDIFHKTLRDLFYFEDTNLEWDKDLLKEGSNFFLFDKKLKQRFYTTIYYFSTEGSCWIFLILIPAITKVKDIEGSVLKKTDFPAFDQTIFLLSLFEEQKKALEEAFYAANDLVELNKEMKENKERFEFAFEGTKDALWDWDIESGALTVSDNWLQMLGYTRDEIKLHFETWKNLIHPEDKEEFLKSLKNHLEKKEPYEVEFRLHTKEGHWKWILSRGNVIEWSKGNAPKRMIGTHINIHVKKCLEEEVSSAKKLLEAGAEANNVLLTSENFSEAVSLSIRKIAEGSSADRVSLYCAYHLSNLDPSECIFTKEDAPLCVLTDFETLELWSKWQKSFNKDHFFSKNHKQMDEEEKEFFEKRGTIDYLAFPIAMGRIFYGFILLEFFTPQEGYRSEIFAFRAFSSSLGGFFSRNNTEESLRVSEARLKKIFEASQEGILTIGEHLDITMANVSAEELMEVGENEAIGTKISQFFVGEEQKLVEQAIRDRFSGENKETELILDVTWNSMNGKKTPIEMSISCLERAGGKFVVSIIRDISERKKNEKMLQEARKKEEVLGAKIQQSLLLGKVPVEVQDLDIGALTIPSQGVDGDFYDFFLQGGEYLDVMLGDVMGKGVPAALLGAGTKAAFNRAITTLTLSLNGHRRPHPEEIVRLVHSQVTAQMIDISSFMTLCYARFDIRLNQMVYVDCGHGHLAYFSSNKEEWTNLRGNNVPLGFNLQEVYTQEQVSFSEKDIFVFYSDGIVEAKNPNGDMYGSERLWSTISDNKELSARALTEKCLEDLKNFASKTGFDDDVTLIIVKIVSQETDLKAVQSLVVPSQMESLGFIRNTLNSFCEKAFKYGWQEEDSIEMNLAVNEAITNIIRHAHKAAEGEKIYLSVFLYIDRLDINLEYFGEPFSVGDITLPAYDYTKEGGFGLYIIQKMVDTVLYTEGEEGRRKIVLSKNMSLRLN